MNVQQDLALFPFPMGSVVIDKVTGLEGTATVFSVKYKAAPMVWIEPAKGSDNQNTIAVDVQRVNFKEARKDVKAAASWSDNVDFDLGDPVLNTLTKQPGIVVERS